MEDFSLIILCRGQRHLLSQTLDSLNPQQGAFEALLLGEGELAEQVHRYPQLHLRVQKMGGSNLAEMMNEGTHLAKGKYIQFLQPGDRYISQHAFAFLSELIQTHNQPDLIYSNTLERGSITPVDRTMARSPWFLREKVLAVGGFDGRFSSRPVLDLLCRLKETRALFCNRVLVETSPHPQASFETCKILYRHFGLAHSLKWLLLQRTTLLHRTTAFLKDAFWQEK